MSTATKNVGAMDVKETNRRVIEQFRAGGEIEGMHRDRLVLLTTHGRRTGTSHTTPMMFYRHGDRILVMAADSGNPRVPDWYRNVLADPHVTVEIGDDRYEATATPLEGEEYVQAWADVTKAFPFFAEYPSKANRTIPVVALKRD